MQSYTEAEDKLAQFLAGDDYTTTYPISIIGPVRTKEYTNIHNIKMYIGARFDEDNKLRPVIIYGVPIYFTVETKFGTFEPTQDGANLALNDAKANADLFEHIDFKKTPTA